MYNEITRKLTSLTLMAVMLAGGLTFAAPGMEPAYAADGDLSVSAEAVGNFAGIQVIEIVVSDPDRSSTDESEGIPNVELNGDDVLMVQGDDGAWYAYVANSIAVDTFDAGSGSIIDIYGQDNIITSLAGSDSISIYNSTNAFLDGSKDISPLATNNPAVDADEWPFIQTYDIPDNTQVTITYGTGSTADTVVLTYDYDDTKDLTLDRNRYPASAGVIISLDDSLLNLSPTADDYWAFNSTKIFYFQDSDITLATAVNIGTWSDIGFEEGPLSFDVGTQEIFNIVNSTLHDDIKESYPGEEGLIILSESTTDDNVFVNFGEDDLPNIFMNSDNSVTGSGTIEYNDNHSVILDTFNAVIKLITPIDEWLSGIEIGLELIDEDQNLNSAVDEDLSITGGEVPYIKIGNPIHFGNAAIIVSNTTNSGTQITDSQVYNIINDATDIITINGTIPYFDFAQEEQVFNYVNLDFTDLNGGKGTFYMGTPDETVDHGALPSGVTFSSNQTSKTFEVVVSGLDTNTDGNVYFDIFSFGQQGDIANNDGEINDNIARVNDAFYRFALEETDDNTAKFEGTLEYLMINQLNVFDQDTYDSIETADDSIVIIVNDDMDDVDAVRVSYNDVISTGNDETISVQEDANTHTGTISFDSTSYSSGNTITVTLVDVDLNTDSDTPQIYQIEDLQNWVGNSDVWLSQLTFDDQLYAGCGTVDYPDQKDFGLNATSFSFIETSDASGMFVGTLKLPTNYCDSTTTNSTTNGVDIEFVYQDYSDASGNPNETTTSAGVRSNTGSVSFDRTVFPVPYDNTQFAVHEVAEGVDPLPAADTKVVIRVNDPDFNVSANGEDTLPISTLKLEIARGSLNEVIVLPTTDLVEIAPDAGIFEIDVLIPQQEYDGLGAGLTSDQINQGDIISVTYTDPADASGDSNTVTDSATFDLRNGVLQTDKSVYIIGSDAIITLIDPDLNLDSEEAETHSLDLINWDSDAGDLTLSDSVFSPDTSGLRETGENTGIFQVVVEIPERINGDKLERGEEIKLEYTDHGPAGADYVGDDDEDIKVTLFTSNFGATVELDQKVYTWTDKVYVTIVAPDHNFDSNAIDEIGVDKDNEIHVATRSDELDNYKLVETGTDTGIFTGEITLTGFAGHDADGDGDIGDATGELVSNGPTSGKIPSSDDDGLTVSFEFSEDENVFGTALIRWNIGEIQWLEASYPATGSGTVRVIDPDMNLNPESVDSFSINVWSDTAAGGIDLAVTETNEATGIFEGTVFFTVTDSSAGSRLAVSEGDTVIAEYEDNTLPDPYTTADELDVTATTLIGTIVPPLERAPAGNLRAVDAFGNSLSTVQVDQQVQLTADVRNGQDKTQEFAYLVQIQDMNGVTVSLSWITGELSPDQSFSPAVSWIPTHVGDYTATTFVWASVDNPTALSPPVSTVIAVN